MPALISTIRAFRAGECRERTCPAIRSAALEDQCRRNPSAVALASRAGNGLRTRAAEAEERHGLRWCIEVGCHLAEQAREAEGRLGNHMPSPMHHVECDGGIVPFEPDKTLDRGRIVRVLRREACHIRTC